MAEKLELLTEREAVKNLKAYLGRVAAFGETTTLEMLQGVADDFRLHESIASVIAHNGIPDTYNSGRTRIYRSNKSPLGRLARFDAYHDEPLTTLVITSEQRWPVLKARKRKSVMYPGTDLENAFTHDETSDKFLIYGLNDCSPDRWEMPMGLPSRRFYNYSEDGLTPPDRASFAVMAAEARKRAPETMAGFLRVSNTLLQELLLQSSKK